MKKDVRKEFELRSPVQCFLHQSTIFSNRERHLSYAYSERHLTVYRLPSAVATLGDSANFDLYLRILDRQESIDV